MEISREDVSAIDPQARAAALRHFNLDQAAWLGKGTEAEVYRLSESRVLKLYADPRRATKLEVLKSFYASLQPASLGFALPEIYDIVSIQGLLAVEERRIEGRPLADVLPTLEEKAAADVRHVYLDAVLKLGEVQSPYGRARYLLFDDADTSDASSSSFGELIYQLARVKLERRRAALTRDVVGLNEKDRALGEACRLQAGDGPRSVIHGDFFPGNVLVDPSLVVRGVVDFGSFTMFGDRLYDVALACVLYDMYGPNRVTVRDELVALAVERLGSHAESALYRYAMAYAFLSCDLYADPGGLREDDHYRWAVDLLNTERYWRLIRR